MSQLPDLGRQHGKTLWARGSCTQLTNSAAVASN